MIHVNNTSGFPSLFITIINIQLMWFGEAATSVFLSGISRPVCDCNVSLGTSPSHSIKGKRKPQVSANQQGTEQALEQD